jgi:hypothetical protein
MNVDETLADRGKRYGDFTTHADISQKLKAVMRGQATDPHPGLALTLKWASLPHHHQEALEMIVHKIGRILNGDPNYADNWHDIAGYAKLAEERCNPKEENTNG